MKKKTIELGNLILEIENHQDLSILNQKGEHIAYLEQDDILKLAETLQENFDVAEFFGGK